MTTEQVLNNETTDGSFGRLPESNDNSLRQALSLIGRCFAEQARIAEKKNKATDQLKDK